ncbi:MAG: response regulator transcription factor [Polyangiaceae bacterium]
MPVTDNLLRRRILIVDDHPLLRKGMTALINQETDLVVVAEASNASEAIRLITAQPFDLVTIDISLPGSDGLDLVRSIHQSHPQLALLVLSMHDEVLYAERALRAGAMGFVMKQEAADTLLHAIRRILLGHTHVSERIATRMLKKLTSTVAAPGQRSLDCLSDRELTVFRMIGQGRTTRQIAEELHVSIKTVETHRAHLKEKLGISSGAELVRCACVWSVEAQ